jgi:hypothetical protein
MDFAGWRLAAAIHLEPISAQRAKEAFGENAPVGVPGAEKENAEPWMHGRLFQPILLVEMPAPFKVVTKLSQSRLWRF